MIPILYQFLLSFHRLKPMKWSFRGFSNLSRAFKEQSKNFWFFFSAIVLFWIWIGLLTFSDLQVINVIRGSAVVLLLINLLLKMSFYWKLILILFISIHFYITKIRESFFSLVMCLFKVENSQANIKWAIELIFLKQIFFE
jgi:hypothetical protein